MYAKADTMHEVMIIITGLILLAFILLFMELFVPGGLLGLLAVCCILGAGYTGYVHYGVGIGVGITLTASLLAVVMFFVAIRLLKAGGSHISVQSVVSGHSVDRPESVDLVGKHGEALTSLVPGGRVRVEGKPYEATSLSGLLRKGAEIEVVRVEDFRIIVKKV